MSDPMMKAIPAIGRPNANGSAPVAPAPAGSVSAITSGGGRISLAGRSIELPSRRTFVDWTANAAAERCKPASEADIEFILELIASMPSRALSAAEGESVTADYLRVLGGLPRYWLAITAHRFSAHEIDRESMRYDPAGINAKGERRWRPSPGELAEACRRAARFDLDRLARSDAQCGRDTGEGLQ